MKMADKPEVEEGVRFFHKIMTKMDRHRIVLGSNPPSGSQEDVVLECHWSRKFLRKKDPER